MVSSTVQIETAIQLEVMIIAEDVNLQELTKSAVPMEGHTLIVVLLFIVLVWHLLISSMDHVQEQ